MSQLSLYFLGTPRIERDQVVVPLGTRKAVALLAYLALAHTRRWLALDPYYEPAHRLLMTLYAQSGERTAALQQYQSCVRLLGNDLQTEPETETTHLYLHLRDGQTGGEDIRGIATTPLTRSHRHNLPVPPTPFVGREGEMAQITRLLAEPHCRLLTKYDCFQKALQAAWKIHSAPLALNVLTGIGMVWHQQGDVQAALALWVFALAHPANDQPQREVAIRLLRKVDPRLPQRITAVAQTTETGLALDTVVTAVLDSAVPVTAVRV